MPSFEDIEVKATVTVDFEVFCAKCGEGLCNISDTRKSRIRNQPQVTVGNCPKCYGALEERIEELKQEAANLQDQIDNLKAQL